MAAASLPYDEAWLPGYDGHQFYTRTWRAADPTAVVLYVHGFADHISRYDDVHCAWPQRGVTLFTYDLRGYGKTAFDTEHRSPDAAYGRTSRKHELSDLQWWLEHVVRQFPNLPLFLVGYSAGGGLALSYATQTSPALKSQTEVKLAGVVAATPLICMTHPPPAYRRVLVGFLSKIAPDRVIPAPQPEERFSRIPAVVEALKKDPLRKAETRMKPIMDLLDGCEQLLKTDWQNWPKDLPLLVLHGTADQVNSPLAAQEFYEKVQARDKKLVLYPDAFHDLFHETDDLPKKTIGDILSWTEAHVPHHEPTPARKPSDSPEKKSCHLPPM